MAAHGFRYQKVRNSVTSGVIAASFLFGGVIEEPPETPPFGAQLVHAAEPISLEPARSFLLPSNLRSDVEPELYRRIVQPALTPEIPPQSFLLESNTREDISPELIRRVIAPAVERKAEPPASFQLGANLRGDIQPEVYRRAIVAAPPLAPAVSVLVGALSEEIVAPEPPAGGLVTPLPEPLPPLDASFALVPQQVTDLNLEITRRTIVAAEPLHLPQSTLLSGFVGEDVVLPVDAEITRAVVVAAQPLSIPDSTLHGAPLVNDVDTNGGLSVASARHRDRAQALQATIRSAVLIDAVAPEIPPHGARLVHAALQDRPTITTLRDGQVPADVIPPLDPEITRQAVVQAARHQITPLSWLRDGQVPDDVAIVHPSAGVKFSSAHHRERHVVPQSFLRDTFVRPAPEKSVRYIQIVPYPDATQHPLFVGNHQRSFVYPGVIEYLPFLTHYRWYDNDNADVNLTTAIAAEDTVLGIENFATSRHLRLALENRGGDGRTATYQLQAALNGGSWFDVAAASSNTRAIDGLPTDGAPVTPRLTRVKEFVLGGYDEVDGVQLEVHDAQTHIEFVFSIEFIAADLDTGDELAFRLREETPGETARVIPALVNPRAAIGEIAPDPIIVAADDDIIVVDAEAIACGETDANTITVAAEDDTIIVDVDDDTVTVDA
jgi:hypothetical protein